MKLIKEICFEPEMKHGEHCQSVCQYKLRKAARALVFNAKGEIALMNVSKHNYYKLPGGGIEFGEDIQKALAREIKEEVGATAEIVDELGTIIEYRNEHNLIQISYCFVAKVLKLGKNNLDASERSSGFKVEWHTVDKAIELLKNSKPTGDANVEYTCKYMRARDLAFVLEYKTRRHMGKQGIGGFLLRNNKGIQEVLLMKRGKNTLGSGKWSCSFGGGVDSDEESFSMCAVREAKEEIGIEFDPNKAVFQTTLHMILPKPIGQIVGHFYFIDKWQGEPKICECDKCECLEWFPLDKLPPQKDWWLESTRQVIENYLNKVIYSEIGFKKAVKK